MKLIKKKIRDLLRGRVGSVSLLKEITQRKQMEDALRIKDSAIDSSINGIVLSNLEGYLTYANQSFLKMWGYDEKEVMGKHILKFCQKEDEVTEVIEELQDEGWVGETKARRKDGSLFDVSFSASTVKDKNNNPICMMASFIDITETVQLREKLREMSINDELTGLYNRRGFLTLAEQQLKIAKRLKRGMLLLFADLDGMKQINDTFGHNEGDQALIDTANILKKTFREMDILARFGGDEFVVLTTDASESSAEILTTRLYKNLTAHNSKETCRHNLLLSIGISCYDPEIPASLEELISRADSAMYEQKERMNSMNGEDHRKQKRIPFVEDILVDGTMLFTSIDISEGGLYVYTGRSFEENRVVNVTLNFKDKKFSLAAKVMHNQPGIGMGLKFINLSDEQKAIIKKIIESIINESAGYIKEKNKILLIEDDDMTRQIHKSRLLMEGFFVIEARDGIEAINLLKKQTPNLIILDLYIEKIDGFKVLSILKMSPEWKDIPVIVSSTKGTQDLMEKVIKTGADEFLNKMVTSPSKLAETVKAVLQRRHKI